MIRAQLWALKKPSGQGVNGDKGPVVGPFETMVPRLPGQGVNSDKGPAVGPRETTSAGS